MNQSRREIIADYVRTMRIHASTMAEYNRNMATILQMWAMPATPANTRSNSEDVASVLLYLSQLNTEYGSLTQTQIDAATETVRYGEQDTEQTQSCPISLDDFQEGEMVCRIRHCGHIFKRENLMRWFSTHTCCPVCRHNIVEQPSASQQPASSIMDVLTRMMDISGNYTYTFDLPLARR